MFAVQIIATDPAILVRERKDHKPHPPLSLVAIGSPCISYLATGLYGALYSEP